MSKTISHMKMPLPTLLDPHVQLRWAFNLLIVESSPRVANAIRNALMNYMIFIKETGAYYAALNDNPRFYLEKYWEQDALIRFNDWLTKHKPLKSKTRYAVYKCLRSVMDLAYVMRLINEPIYHAPMYKGVNETDQRTAYSETQQEIINASIYRWVDLARSVQQGYQKTNSGIPTLMRNPKGARKLVIDGMTYNVQEAVQKFNVSANTIDARLKRGCSDREAVGLDRKKNLVDVIEFRGEVFKSWSTLAGKYNVCPGKLQSKIRQGLSIEAALGFDKTKEIIVGETTFSSLKAACEFHDISPAKAGVRLRNGWSVEEALELVKRSKGMYKCIVEGVTYPSISAAAERYSIASKTAATRLQRGWSIEQTFGVAPPPPLIKKVGRTKSITIAGKSFESISSAARYYNIPIPTFINRLKIGWTPELAAGIEPRKSDYTASPARKSREEMYQIILEGKTYANIKVACAQYDIELGTVYGRLSNSWSLNEAFEIDDRNNVNKNREIEIEGITYESHSKAAQAYNVQRKTLTARIDKGWSPEEAIGLIPKYVNMSDDRFALWDFENTFDSDPLRMFNFYIKHRRPVYNMKRLLKLFENWGVWPWVDASLIMPLAMELSILTGLNAESIRELSLDSYTSSHPLTQQPCIQYIKRRGANAQVAIEKDLHIPLLQVDEFYPSLEICSKVENIITIVKSLTQRIRTQAKDDIKNKLFIFEVVDETEFKIVDIDWRGHAGYWRTKFAKDELLFDQFGEKFSFNVARCRPTLITNMCLAGKDLFQIQVAVGHRSIRTTASYLDEHQLKPAYNKIVSAALGKIAERSKDSFNAFDTKSSEPEFLSPKFHETLSGCGCKNPFNPSKNVRETTKYVEGSVCKYWNMCLLCDKSVITPNSLPKLIRYRSKLSLAISSESNSIKTRMKLFEDIVAIIDGIMEPDAIFPKEVIETANQISFELDDEMLDQLIYQGI